MLDKTFALLQMREHKQIDRIGGSSTCRSLIDELQVLTFPLDHPFSISLNLEPERHDLRLEIMRSIGSDQDNNGTRNASDALREIVRHVGYYGVVDLNMTFGGPRGRFTLSRVSRRQSVDLTAGWAIEKPDENVRPKIFKVNKNLRIGLGPISPSRWRKMLQRFVAIDAGLLHGSYLLSPAIPYGFQSHFMASHAAILSEASICQWPEQFDLSKPFISHAFWARRRLRFVRVCLELRFRVLEAMNQYLDLCGERFGFAAKLVIENGLGFDELDDLIRSVDAGESCLRSTLATTGR